MFMKKCILVLFAFFMSMALHAQNWNANISTAVKEASQNNKKILLFFTVENQCENCTKLEQNIFKSDDFIAFANENYNLVKIKFGYNSASNLSEEEVKQNLLIVEKYNKDGFFPLVVVLNKEAKKLGNIGVYKNETPSQYIALLHSIEKI